MSEVDQIKKRYEKRLGSDLVATQSRSSHFIFLSRAEREYHATLMLKKHLGSDLSNLNILEIGAGYGDNVHFLMRAGFAWKNIFLNELLPERCEALKAWFPKERLWEGDILKFPDREKFNLIYQSTVFSSILDKDLRKAVVDFTYESLEEEGYFLWYDFCFDNPKNKDVKGVSRSEVLELMGSRFELIASKKVTLAPPIGRRVKGWYSFINFLFPFLRTHQILLFKKRASHP